MGLTPRGQGARAIKEGWTQKDGKLPVNPSGGLKAKGHPIGATGVSMHVMTAMQLSGQAPEGMQLANAKLGRDLQHGRGRGRQLRLDPGAGEVSGAGKSDEHRLLARRNGKTSPRSAGASDRLRSRRGLQDLCPPRGLPSAQLYRAIRGSHPAIASSVFAINCTQYLECFYGIWWMGAVAIPINAKLHGREAAWICSDAGTKLVFVSDDTTAALMEAKADLPPSIKLISLDSEAYRAMREGEGASAPLERDVDDLAWLFYTSGTTGRPKGVMLSHGNLVAASTCYLIDVDPATPNDASTLCRADLAWCRPL